MRKRIIITNALIVIFAMVISLITSIVTMSNYNYGQANKQLRDYLDLSCSFYDGTNGQELIDILKDTDDEIRVTILDLDGNILLDSLDLGETDSHLNREEIASLGKIVQRHSNTLDKTMIYIAARSHESFLRVAIPANSLTPVVNQYIAVSVAFFFIILGISILIIWSITNGMLKPLNMIAKKMKNITGESDFVYSNSVESLSETIDLISEKIDYQMHLIKSEKEKLDYIINNIKQGIVGIYNDDIVLINNFALTLFKLKEKQIINKNYYYSFRDLRIQEIIKEAKDQTIDIDIDKAIYKVDINCIGAKKIIVFTNVTDIRNIEKIKREFFANASHELKSPLTTIMGYQQMINEGIIEDKMDIKEATQKTINEASRMNNIIIEMLELSKLESGADYVISNILVKEVVEDAISSLMPKIEEKQIKLNTTFEDVHLNAAYEHIFTLVKNLVDNAVKYNINHGKISIEIKKDLLKISDTGIGIAKEDQNRVFERFYRVDKAKSKELGGTGLGLAIVKHICAIYNYRIELISDGKTGTEINIYWD